jgi:uncharacterized protein (TIGR03435 family)
MTRTLTAAGFYIFALARVFGQTTAPAFEVATVKPSAPGVHGMSLNFSPGGRFTATNVPLRMLITFAWTLQDHQLTGGPGWLGSDTFDIVGKPAEEIPNNDAGHERLRLLVRSLVTERFKLEIHTETKDLPIYALVLAKNGPKLVAAGTESIGANIRGSRGQLTCVKVSTSMLAQQLAARLGRNVVDKTGLSGDYDFKLEWQPDTGEVPGKGGDRPPDAINSDAPAGPSLFTALQEQLGLKLEAQKGPVEILVVDHAEKPPGN